MNSGRGQVRDPVRVQRAVIHNTIFRLISQMAGALSFVLIVRLLSERDFGYYQLFYTVPTIIATLFSMGIANTLLRYLPEYLQNAQFRLARRLVTVSLQTRMVVTSLVLITIYAFWDSLAPILKIGELRNYFVLFSAIVVTMFQTRILATSLSAFLLQQWSVGSAAAFAIVKLLGYASALHFGLTLTTALVVDLAAHLTFYIGVRYAYNKYIPRPKPGDISTFSPGERKRLLRYAAFYNFNDAGSLALMNRADYLFIAGFMSPTAVAVYAFCTQLDHLVKKLLPMGFFFGVIQPVVFTLDYATERAKVRQYFQLLVKVTFLVQVPTFVLIAAVPEALISEVFAGKYIEYTAVLVSVFAFSTASAAQEPIFLIAQLEERAGIVMASKIFSVFNVVANIVLIPILGVMGAVIATGLTVCFKNIFVWYFVRRAASFAGMLSFFLRQSVLWLACWQAVRWMTSELAYLPSLVLAGGLVAVVAVASPRFADFSAFERRLISRALGPRFDRALQLAGLGQR